MDGVAQALFDFGAALNGSEVGLGTHNAVARFDNFSVGGAVCYDRAEAGRHVLRNLDGADENIEDSIVSRSG